ADDGIGSAGFGTGSGLTGLRDRVAALGGRLEIVSPAGHGTVVSAEIPLLAPTKTALPVADPPRPVVATRLSRTACLFVATAGVAGASFSFLLARREPSYSFGRASPLTRAAELLARRPP